MWTQLCARSYHTKPVPGLTNGLTGDILICHSRKSIGVTNNVHNGAVLFRDSVTANVHKTILKLMKINPLLILLFIHLLFLMWHFKVSSWKSSIGYCIYRLDSKIFFFNSACCYKSIIMTVWGRTPLKKSVLSSGTLPLKSSFKVSVHFRVVS